MRRWFLALMTLLVTAQMSWAGAQLCCVEELGEQQHQTTAQAAQADKAGDTHPVCETGHCHCHHAGCATPLDEAEGLPVSQPVPPEPGVAARPKSHIPAGLDRPNWQRA